MITFYIFGVKSLREFFGLVWLSNYLWRFYLLAGELAGFDARNLAQNRLIAKGVPTAQDDKPVLIMKSLVEKQKREAEAQANPRKEETEEDWDAFTSDFFKALGKANTAP